MITLEKVSIVIPCRNEEKYIARCLDSILSQSYPVAHLSVYVCDGKSTDATPSIVLQYAEKHSQITLLVNEKQHTPAALNIGITKSTASVVIILGAHAKLYPDYVQNCLKAFELNPKIGCVGGLLENVYDNSTAEIIGKAMSSSFGVGNAYFRTGGKSRYVDTVAFGAYKREVFDRIGLFDEELIRNQDDEFNFRLTQAGYLVYLSSDIRSEYYVRASYNKLFKQYYQYGYWKVYVNKKHRTITTIRQMIPLFFVLFLLGGVLLSLILPVFLTTFLLVLTVYFVLSLYSAMKSSEKFEAVLGVVFTFFILHVAYGWGYLKGIVHFFLLNKKIKREEVLTR